MKWPTSNQVNAGLRHAGTAGGAVVTVFGVLGLLSQEDAAKVIANLHTLVDSLTLAFGAFSAIVAIVGPVAIGLFVKGAVASASITSQLKAVTTNKTIKIDGQIIAPPDVAKAVPSDKVVSNNGDTK
jgi:hypothetical protein